MRRRIGPIGRIALAIGTCLSAAALALWGMTGHVDHLLHDQSPTGTTTVASSSWSLGSLTWSPSRLPHVGGGAVTPDSSSWS